MSNNLVKKFGKNLKKIREKQGLTQEELAFKVNLNRTYIGRIERGERNISLVTAEKIAQALHIKIHDLLRLGQKKL
jgi:transcriptional regulator with XRE-family HTH domain